MLLLIPLIDYLTTKISQRMHKTGFFFSSSVWFRMADNPFWLTATRPPVFSPFYNIQSSHHYLVCPVFSNFAANLEFICTFFFSWIHNE